jgi:hypothetical protein
VRSVRASRAFYRSNGAAGADSRLDRRARHLSLQQSLEYSRRRSRSIEPRLILNSHRRSRTMVLVGREITEMWYVQTAQPEAVRHTRAWLLLVGALAIHVTDEAATGFLDFSNPLVGEIRSTVRWFPMPTFTFGIWLTGLAGPLTRHVLNAAVAVVFRHRARSWPRICTAWFRRSNRCSGCSSCCSYCPR